ncbi:MAG: helix-turn-helix domain-containing protein [Clostridia bacterium]|nr:helix-turn-helix domain-containing protein [Clostridia bacterium]
MEKSIQLENIQMRLRKAILQSSLTQREIAQKVGVSAQTVSKYMRVNVFPALDTLAKLCQVLDISADYILGLTD